jgi:hypothetical protein
VQSKATTVAEYLAELSEDRREAISAVRDVVRKNLDAGFKEGMQYGMIGYFVPHEIYPSGYHCDPRQPLPFAALGSQKNYMSLYLMCVYGNPNQLEQLQRDWAKTGKKLDMGKACIRFARLSDLPLEVIGSAIRRVTAKRYIEICEQALASSAKRDAKKPRHAQSESKSPRSKNPTRSSSQSKRKTAKR